MKSNTAIGSLSNFNLPSPLDLVSDKNGKVLTDKVNTLI